MEKKWIKDENGNKVLPYTHTSAVLDNEGNDLNSHLGNFEDEMRGLVETPHQNYVTVDTYSSLPQEGSTDTIYRVSNYDGSQSQVSADVYSEYAWNGSQYILLCVKSAVGEVFDITVYNNNTKYADLTAALGTNGANVPQELRKGGMSVKFVQSFDHNYIHCILLSQNFSTDVNDWMVVNQLDKEVLGKSVTVTGGSYSSKVYISGASGDIIFLKGDVVGDAIITRLYSGNTNVSTINLNKIKEGLFAGVADNSFDAVTVFLAATKTVTLYTNILLLGRVTTNENDIAELKNFDNYPTEGSNHAVKSKGIADRLNRIVHGANLWLSKTIKNENCYYALNGTYPSDAHFNVAQIALNAGDKIVIKGFGYHNTSSGNPWSYKFTNTSGQNISGNIEITESLTENFTLTAPANTANLILSYYKTDDGNIDIYMDVDRISVLETKVESLEDEADILDTKTKAIDADYSIDIFDSSNINNKVGYAYRLSAHAVQQVTGWNLAFISGMSKGETILVKGVNYPTYGYVIKDISNNTLAEDSIEGDTFITIPNNGYSIQISYSQSQASDFHVYLRASDFNARKIAKKSIDVSLPVKGARENVVLVNCDYVSSFKGVMFNGKEYHFSKTVENHAPSSVVGKPIVFEVDADGNRRCIDIFGTLESVTDGRWASECAGVTRDGNYMLSVALCQNITDNDFYPKRELIYVFDRNLDTVATIDVLSSGVKQMFGNILETPEHHLIFTAYGTENNVSVAKVWRSVEAITDTWNLTFEEVYTVPVNADECTVGYVSNVLCLIARVSGSNTYITFCEDLEGADSTKWDSVYSLGHIIHSPAILPYCKNNVFPFAGSLGKSATVRVPCVCYYDLENRQLLSVTDVSNGEIQGWGGYPSFIQIEDGVFAMMYYDDYSNNYTTVFYQRVNARYKCDVSYFL